MPNVIGRAMKLKKLSRVSLLAANPTTHVTAMTSETSTPNAPIRERVARMTTIMTARNDEPVGREVVHHARREPIADAREDAELVSLQLHVTRQEIVDRDDVLDDLPLRIGGVVREDLGLEAGHLLRVLGEHERPGDVLLAAKH